MTNALPPVVPSASAIDALMAEVESLRAEREALQRAVQDPEPASRGGRRSADDTEVAMELFQQIPDPLHFLDGAGRISHCNRAWLSLFGYERNEVVGHELRAFVAEQDRTTELLDRLVAGGGTDVMFKLVCKDGSTRGVAATSMKAPEPTTGRPRILTRLRDVSNIEQLQQAAAHQEKLASVGMLAAGVAHEINNPIGFIASMLGSLDKYSKRLTDMLDAYRELEDAAGRGDMETAKAHASAMASRRKAQKIDFIVQSLPGLISRCQEGAERVKKIVSDLRSFARTDDNVMAETDLNQVMETALNMAWNELKYKAEVKNELGEIPRIIGNASKLSQVFINFLVNASHAIESKGTVTVRTELRDGKVTASVSDTGSGIKPEHVAKLFDAFFTTKPVGKGTGLGLNIAYNIIKQHGAEVRVESEVGKGTTFYVDFPTN